MSINIIPQQEIKTFNFTENLSVRVVINEMTKEEWFAITDICKALELSNPTMVAESLDEDDLSSIEVIDSLGRKQIANATNESGLYQLIFQSRKPSAKKFKRWVTSEVLPTIRKTGSYSPKLPTHLETAKLLVESLEKNEAMALQIEKDKPLVSYANAVKSSINSVSIRDWIKSLTLPRGMKQKDVFDWLDSKYTYFPKDEKKGRRAKAEYEYKGWFELVPVITATPSGSVERFQLKITGEGQIGLSSAFNKKFIA